SVGTTVPIDIVRNGKATTLRAQVGERPPEQELANSFSQPSEDDFSDQDQQSTKQATQQLLGLAVQPLTPAIARQVGVPPETKGVVIAAVDPSTDAGTKGLRRGDVIVLANGQPVASDADLAKAAQAA